MRKLKYILASVVLAAGFASCETEPIDEKVKDDSLPGKPIFSFDLNAKETVVTDKVTVDFNGNSITINARLSLVNHGNTSNPELRYKAANLAIMYSTFTVGNFPTTLSIDNPSNFLSTATLNVQEMVPDEEEEGVYNRVWVQYSTLNADEKQNAGYGNITRINDIARYMSGNFDYLLIPTELEDEDIDLTLEPQRITKGNYNYLPY
ncbi:MAG: hypothetical protein RSE50_13610 [Myroides sp.]